MNLEYRQYCEDMLPQVSRTFALGISLLKDPLMIEIGVSYLICRICDSVEDTNAIMPEIRQNLLEEMASKICTANREKLLEKIKNTFPLSQFSGAEYEVLHNIYQVMSIFDTFPPEVQKHIQECVIEMAEGMAITVSREQNHRLDGLTNTTDLKQYCYYVAGTVGKLLTKLFIHDRPNISNTICQELEKKEIAFGLGLQMTNILKGVYEDHHRGVIYLPKNILKKYGLNFENLLSDSKRQEGGKLVLEMIEFILPFMDQAIDYTLLIPETESDIRLFCALPVLFALRTLKLAKQNPESILTSEPLKIKRKEVKDLHIEADKCITDNTLMRELFARERNF